MENLSDHEDADNKKPTTMPAMKPFNAALDPSDPLGFLDKAFEFLAAESYLFERDSMDTCVNAVVRMMKDKAETEDERKKKRAKIEGVVDNAEKNIEEEEVLPSPPPVKKEETKEVEETESKVEEENKGLRAPNKGNGLDMANYSWGQTLEYVKITIPVPPGTMTRNIIECEIMTDRIKFGLKGQPPVLDGELCKPINFNESFWFVDDTSPACICLMKQATGKDWWKYIVKGEPEIDTRKVKPEKRKLRDPAAFEKIRQEKIEKYKAKYPGRFVNYGWTRALENWWPVNQTGEEDSFL